MWYIINSIQFVFIVIMTLFSALFGVILMLITRNSDFVMKHVAGTLWGRSMFLILGIRLKVIGRENINKSSTAIYVSNHASQLDIPAIVLATQLPLYFLAKKELTKIPFLGWYLKLTKQILIERKNKEKSMESLNEAIAIIQAGKNVMSFPEGTRSKDGEVKMFRRGSFIIAKNGNIPLVPIAVQGAYEALPPNKFKFRPGTITVSIGKPVIPDDNDAVTVEQLAKKLEAQVKSLKAAIRGKESQN